MTKNNAIVAIFAGHHAAETAIRILSEGGLRIKHFSIVGKRYHTEETVADFYNTGDLIKFWGQNCATGSDL